MLLLLQVYSGTGWLLLQELRVSGDTDFMQLCRPWAQNLLLGGTSLTELTMSVGLFPCYSFLGDLSLRYLELIGAGQDETRPEGLFVSVSRCLTLDSLAITCNEDGQMYPSNRLLPSMQLQSMPSLKHLSLENCLPAHELSLPADCALHLTSDCDRNSAWHKHWEKCQAHATTLDLVCTDYGYWLPGIQCLNHLQCLELRVPGLPGQDLADLQNIAQVKIVLGRSMSGEECLRLSSGAWQSLEVFHLGQLDLVINDVNSFVRDTGSFTFMSEIGQGESHRLIQDVQEACLRHGKACHVVKHCSKQGSKLGQYITLSTSQEVAQRCPIISIESNDSEVAAGEALSCCMQCITLVPRLLGLKFESLRANIVLGETLIDVLSGMGNRKFW